MYDELIKRLRNRRICIQQSGSLDDFPLLKEAADAIEELSKPRWIPVSERLPEVNERVMACVKVFGELLVYDATRWNGEQWETEVEAYYDYWAKIDEHVTHWMPLPEPPKEE